MRRLALALCLAAGLALGCGESRRSEASAAGQPQPSQSAGVCNATGRAAFSRFLRTQAHSVTATARIGGNSMPECSFSGPAGNGNLVRAVVNIDSGPQAFFRLERTVVEAQQVFTAQRMIAAPEMIDGLGVEADWFPAEKQLIWTDGIRLITVSVNWAGATERREQALAYALSHAYLPGPVSGALELIALDLSQ